MSNKKIGCGCLGCSIPLLTFIILLVIILPLSIFGVMNGAFGSKGIPAPKVELPAEVIFHIGVFPVTNTIITSWITVALLILMALLVTRKPKLIPGRLQSAVEAIIEWMYNFCKDVAGEVKGRKFFPVVTTIFLFVLINALLNLVPGYGTWPITNYAGHEVILLRGANTDINTAAALAVIAFIFIEFWGFKFNGLGYLKKFFTVERAFKGWGKVFHGKLSGFGDVLFGAIDTIVGLLELLLEFVRLLSFTFRLFGNMTGGEILILILFFLLGFAGFGFVQVGYIFEMLVGVVQALIFAGLTLVFATMASEHHGEEEH
ncbi:MAG: F0F1 ATP synthase subunit A [Dehalococcoidales bacterium]|nr:F0F1 ATP synthase subunit A [Dehalococcoidales bacterium]